MTYLETLPHDYPQRPRAPRGYWILNDYHDTPLDAAFELELSAASADVPGPATELLRRASNDTSAVDWRALGEGSLVDNAYRFDAIGGGLSG